MTDEPVLTRADILGALLTPKQRAFCDEYIENPTNQGAAWQKVYKCTPGAANTEACRSLKIPKIKDYIREREHEIAKEAIKGVGFTKEGWLRDMKELALAAEKAGKYSSAIRAREIIGKAGGYVEDSLKLIGDEANPIAVSVTNKIDLASLSVKDLKALQQIVSKAKGEN